MNVWSYITGTVLVEFVAASPEQLITAINNAGIMIYAVTRLDDLTVRAVIKKSDFSALEMLVSRRCEKVRILNRLGLIWSLKNLLRRPVLTLAVCVCLILTLFLPTRVLFVRVEGNRLISSERIMESAERCGVIFGAVRRNIRSEQIKNQMLELLPGLQWIGVNTNGCVATITVRERSTVGQEEEKTAVHGIIASRDGIIRKATATRGTLLCKPGEAVKKGQLLISPYTDCGLTLRAEPAQGEIIADTVHDLNAVSPVNFQLRTGEPDMKAKYSVLIGKKLINLFKYSGISGAGCVRICKEYRLELPGGFQLPVSLIRSTELFFEDAAAEVTALESFAWVDKYMEDYLQTQMIAGSVYDSDTDGHFGEGVYSFFGKYACTEMIGRLTNEEYTDKYGKRN